MQPLRPVIFALLLACAGRSSAQAWNQEPTSVMGIPLGVDYSSLPIGACRGGLFRSITPADGPCTTTSRSIANGVVFGLVNLPDLGFDFRAELVLIRNRVAGVRLVTTHANFSTLLSLLTERYGPPHRDDHGEVQNGVGATFANRKLTWTGSLATVYLTERHGTVQQSQVLIAHSELLREFLDSGTTAVRATAQKL